MNTMTNNVNATSTIQNGQASLQATVTPPSTTPPIGRAKVAISFLLLDTDADLVVASQRILTAMTGNVAYPAPNPSLAELTAARNTYIAAVNAAKDSRLAVTVRKQQRVVFAGLLRNLAHHVQVASGGNLPTLLSSGFPAQRGRQPVGRLPAPANPRLVRGAISGQLIARCRKLPQALGYEWRYALGSTPTAWVNLEAKFAVTETIDGLVPGTQYVAQVRALGTAGPSDWSDSAIMMVA